MSLTVLFQKALPKNRKMTTILTGAHDANSLSFLTGKQPMHGTCPGVEENGIIRSLPQISLNSTRKQLLDYFDNTWALTEVLFDGLASEEAFYRRPYHQIRHPLIFYYAHPAVFYVNKLLVAGMIDQGVKPEFEQLFEIGVDEMRWDDLHESGKHSWPTISDVRQYRGDVYRMLCKVIETHSMLDPEHMPINMDKPTWALVMCFEHERIHMETSAVLIRKLPTEFVRVPGAWPVLSLGETDRHSVENPMTMQVRSVVTLGKPIDWPSFGWDNEYGSESRVVRPFSASAMLIQQRRILQLCYRRRLHAREILVTGRLGLA